MSASGNRRANKEAEEYLSRYKLKEIFQVHKSHDPLVWIFLQCNLSHTILLLANSYCLHAAYMQGLLRRMVVQQPGDPLQFMHDEVSKIKQEMEESHVSCFFHWASTITSDWSNHHHVHFSLLQVDIGSTTFLTTQYPPTERWYH